ncbi:guanine deaminase [Ottowia sp.]|uniref:guanine deaminase n=1 Tax=Ottowia sp. TaxID=1898956 RepID=UPI002B76D50F|nr:guanine deaminase [Ottowia sp.]HOB66733.1 guanine deaminase [Ottowia sp.]HPZ58085.1 guanine deaminase [Ottowia sp.]HQD48372.1 guanine deaminase [Ottowia sp.]
MQSWRASLLRFDEHGHAVFERDGLLVIGAGADGRTVVLAAGAYDALKDRHADVPCTHLPGRLIAPGFVDMHIHYPQIDVIGSPAEGLLPWLEHYTFPHEAQFADPAHAAESARFFCDELQRNGVTTALSFCTSHPASVNALFSEAQKRGLRLIAGKCLQDRHSPDGVRDETEQSLIDTEALIKKWHGVGRLGYAITPRFAPSCSERQLRGAGELAARYPDVWIQSHVAENVDEIAWARALFPDSRSYLAIYADHGLMRRRAVYAHCIHFHDDDRALMRDTHTAAAVCPTSNLFLGSGFFDFAGAERVPFAHGLASDVGGGTSFSPLVTMRAAYFAGRASSTGIELKPGVSLSPERLWWLHTAGAARALDLDGVVGNLQPGCEADFVVLNPEATPLLARRTRAAGSLAELLFALIVLGDDRVVERTVISQAK